MANITVCCKLPNGLILSVGDKDVEIAGSNTSLIIGGVGSTQVDESFWNAWLKDHRELSFVKDGYVFASRKADEMRGKIEEAKDMKTGLEAPAPMLEKFV